MNYSDFILPSEGRGKRVFFCPDLKRGPPGYEQCHKIQGVTFGIRRDREGRGNRGPSSGVDTEGML